MKRLSLMSLMFVGTLYCVATPSHASDKNVFQSASLAVTQACTDQIGTTAGTGDAADTDDAPRFARLTGLLRHFCKNRNASASAQLSGSEGGFSFGNLGVWAGGRQAYDLSSAGNATVSRGFGGIQSIPLTGSKFKLELKPTAATLKLSW